MSNRSSQKRSGVALAATVLAGRLRGDLRRREYKLDAAPLDVGGQAEVFPALHKPSGRRVAFKRVRARDPDSLARMRYEVGAQRALAPHPNVMPVLDHADDYAWYTMPLADAVLDRLPCPIADADLATIVAQCLAGLRAAHAADYVHRDITPRNIMRLTDDGQSRWVVADWGAVRRPRGMTTVLRTQAGQSFGTAGFAPPESWIDAHAMDWRADIYSLGRVVTWATTGQAPAPNAELLPPGRWRPFVAATTATERDQRPRRMEDVEALLCNVVAGLSPGPSSVALAAPAGATRHAVVPPGVAGRIAYVGLDQQLHVLDLADGADVPLHTVGQPYAPRWSPAGDAIVYGERLAASPPMPARSQVAVLDLATGSSRLLVAPEVRFGDALNPPIDYWSYRCLCWTPDGAAIVYKKDSGARINHAYMRVSASGGQPEEILGTDTHFFMSTSAFDISPTDGRMAITESGLDHQMGSACLVVADLDGSNRRTLRPLGGAYYFQPVWTPDGREIAVAQGSGGRVGWMLTLINPDTGAQRVLSPVSIGSDYAFAPGGGWLVLSDGDTNQLSLIDLANFGERHPIGYGHMPTWDQEQ